MSCGDPHDLDCRQALAHLHEYIDGEAEHDQAHQIARHIEGCSECLAEFDVERLVKVIVARSCCDHAPSPLRARVLAELVSIRISLGQTTASRDPGVL